ncbi:uncharacterized protein LOC127137988 [Lathyrus oleraceus]|uniref:uncharacterized protein LOC127137988 n=1 Tax=Pisum sativum TaxID=3888 RepID=UPI0021CE18C3|nr:uncharacterized protein LOC127137988 [Pisum sativum]
MKENEKIPYYSSREILITNKMKSYGETLSEQVIIGKVLRSLIPQFDYIVVKNEHSKDLSTMRIKELQSSLETQELRLTERTSEREVGQALKESSGNKSQKWSLLEDKKRHSGGLQKSKASNSDEKKHRKGKEMFDKKKVQCYCCKNFGHYPADYWLYMETGFSNHLIGNKQWLVGFDSRKRTKITCGDDKYLNTEGMGNVKVKVKNGKIILIKDVWYVPGMKSNLRSVGQLIEKGFPVAMKKNILKLYDFDQKMIMQFEQGSNRTLKVNMETTETKCLNAQEIEAS